MRDHNNYRTHRFTSATGETIDFYFTPATARRAATRTFPGGGFDPWCNWVTSLLWSQENCVQHVASHAEMVTLVGELTLEGWVLTESTPYTGEVNVAALVGQA